MKRFRADRAVNARILNFPDVNNHLAEILIEYLSHSLGLSSDTPGTNTVIGLLKSFMVDLSVLEGLKEWLEEQVSENLIEEAKQAQFNEWVKEHIEHQEEVDTNIQNIRKAISLIMNILNIFGSVEIPPGVIPQYNYNPNFDPNNDEEFEEFINALEEIVTNGWFKSKSYTKNEIDTMLNHYLRDDTSITLTNPLILQNTSFTLGNKTIFSILDAGGFGHTDLPTVGYVSDAITNAFSSTMVNYYTKTETDTILNHYLRDDSSITLTYPLILQNTSFTLGNITVSSILDAGGFGHTDLPTVGYMSDAITNAFSSTMVNYYTKTETDTILNHYLRDDSSITLTYPLILQNTSFTLGNITVSGILDAGSSGHTELPTVGYVNDAIANAGSSSMTNYYTKSEIDTMLNHYLRDDTTITLTYPLNLPSFTLGNITISSILDAGGFGHTDLPTVGYMSNAITNAFSSTMVNYYTKTEIDNLITTLYGFFYPVGSFFLFESRVTLSGGSSGHATNSGTILDYFTWEYVEHGVIGSQGYLSVNSTAASEGYWYINLGNLPAHSHSGLHGFGTATTNQSAYATPLTQSGWENRAGNMSWGFTDKSVGTVVGNAYVENSSHDPFIPHGYYLFCYKRIA